MMPTACKTLGNQTAPALTVLQSSGEKEMNVAVIHSRMEDVLEDTY